MQKRDKAILSELLDDIQRLQRHVSIILALKEEQPAGIIRLSQITELPEHKVRYSLRMLERGGIIKPSRAGAALNPVFLRQSKRIASDLGDLSAEITSELRKLQKALREV